MEVERIISTVKPKLVIGSPPCSWWSRIMQLNWPKISRSRRKAMMDEARSHLKFACRIYAMQHRENRLFIHEHPDTAQSWKEPDVQRLLEMKGVVRRRLDMCRYGLQSQDKDATVLVKKTTSILTNSVIMGDYLGRRCQGGHRHVALKGGRRCALAALYTKEFCEAIVTAFKKHEAHARREQARCGTLKA